MRYSSGESPRYFLPLGVSPVLSTAMATTLSSCPPLHIYRNFPTGLWKPSLEPSLLAGAVCLALHRVSAEWEAAQVETEALSKGVEGAEQHYSVQESAPLSQAVGPNPPTPNTPVPRTGELSSSFAIL